MKNPIHQKMMLSFLFLAMIIAVWFPGIIYQIVFSLILIPLIGCAPNPARIGRFLISMSPFLVITLGVHLFFRIGVEDYWGAFREMELWSVAGYFTLRNLNVMGVVALIFNYKPFPDMDGFSGSLQNRLLKGDGKQYPFSAGLFIGLQYFRVIRDEYRSLIQVHRILGIKKEKGVLKQVRYYSSLIIPLFIGSFERVDQLSVALTTRGFGRSDEYGA
ncbi:energy-coupling factor transporter transmembrane component T [Fidelibacter multiformis]|uniref:energy-coupling factor transporter transmembrane component T n=1 Tax=Fidelibacter multiformis TaxID=3377529 RepID=UPI0037DC736A